MFMFGCKSIFWRGHIPKHRIAKRAYAETKDQADTRRAQSTHTVDISVEELGIVVRQHLNQVCLIGARRKGEWELAWDQGWRTSHGGEHWPREAHAHPWPCTHHIGLLLVVPVSNMRIEKPCL